MLTDPSVFRPLFTDFWPRYLDSMKVSQRVLDQWDRCSLYPHGLFFGLEG